MMKLGGNFFLFEILQRLILSLQNTKCFSMVFMCFVNVDDPNVCVCVCYLEIHKRDIGRQCRPDTPKMTSRLVQHITEEETTSSYLEVKISSQYQTSCTCSSSIARPVTVNLSRNGSGSATELDCRRN